MFAFLIMTSEAFDDLQQPYLFAKHIILAKVLTKKEKKKQKKKRKKKTEESRKERKRKKER